MQIAGVLIQGSTTQVPVQRRLGANGVFHLELPDFRISQNSTICSARSLIGNGVGSCGGRGVEVVWGLMVFCWRGGVAIRVDYGPWVG